MVTVQQRGGDSEGGENDSLGLNPFTGSTVPTSLGSKGVIFISPLPVGQPVTMPGQGCACEFPVQDLESAVGDSL